ncbi:MAG: hypothetical protein JO232_05680 [Verrucomicrobia bacterium]|nr:hypothetical protein [Verrucomicrobiota bacterium]
MQQSFWQRVRNKTELAISAGLVVLTTIAGAEQCRQEIRGEQDPQQSRQNASHSVGQVSALEIEIKKAQERAQLAENIADLAEKKLGALEAAVAKKEDQLEAELKEALERVQSAKREVEFAKDEGSALETELKNSFGRAQLTEKQGKLNDPGAGRKPEMRFSEQVFNGESSTSATVSRPATNADPGLSFISLQENGFPLMQSLGGTQTPAPAFNAETNRPDAQATAPLESSKHRQDLARVTPPIIHNSRQKSFVRPKFVSVKTRLVALWHQSLARSQRPNGPQPRPR